MVQRQNLKSVLLITLVVFLASFSLVWLPLQATTPLTTTPEARYAPSSTQPVVTTPAVNSSPRQQYLQSNAIPVNDGSFENIPSAWSETINETACGNISKIGDWSHIFEDIEAYDGSRYLWLGGICSGPEESTPLINTAEQQIIVPQVQTTLSFWYYVERIDPDSVPNNDFAYVEINRERVWELPLTQANNTYGWVEQTIDLSQYAGNEVLLRFGNEANLQDVYVGNALIDFVSFPQASPAILVVDPETGGATTHTDPLGRTTTIDVPPGAVESPTMLIYQPLEDPQFPFPPGLLYANQAFDLDAFPNLLYLPLLIKGSATGLAQIQPIAVTATQPAATSGSNFGFLRPIQIKLEYRSEDLNGINEDSLALFYWDGESWQDAITSCEEPGDYIRDPDENFISLEICHLSRFALVGN